MAANRFATMLHKNTNKITLILIYAVLEWILIVLLLLNSLFSYLIIKFAEFFGLKSPCLWCTRIDHFLDPAKGNSSMHRDLLCEVHAKEISKLGYCSNHHKLVESQGMCEDCLSSRPEFHGSSKNFALFTWMKGVGIFPNDKATVGENGEVSMNCCCCGVSLDNYKYSSYILLDTSSWDGLECAQKESLITEAGDYDDDYRIQVGFDSYKNISDLGDDDKVVEDKSKNPVVSEFDEQFEVREEETKEENCISATLSESKTLERREDETLKEDKSTLMMEDKSVQVCFEEEIPVETSAQHLEFFLDYSGHTLVPIELVDSMTEEHKEKESNKVGNDEKSKDQDFCLDFEVQVEEKEALVVESGKRVEKEDTFLDVDINEEPKYSMLDAIEIEEDENSLVFHANVMEFEDFRASPLARWPSAEASDAMEVVQGEDSLVFHPKIMEFENFTAFPLARLPSAEASDVQEVAEAQDGHLDARAACEEVAQASNENEADVSIGTEIPDLDITDEIQIQDSVHSYECIQEDPSSSSAHLYAVDDHGPTQVEEQMVELKPLSVEESEDMKNNQSSSYSSEMNENEEDKLPDTPTSVESLNQLHKKLLLLEKRDSMTEESLDGSVTSDLEGSDGVVTIEQLKTALRAERKVLQALYGELEEERSASAVAANQTMAMINRLQEEKAAMQMEALQYERMMEEQCEYDQEALQLLNELMVKREKEKQELERELEGYRKKLVDYETKEKIRLLRRSKDGSTRSGFSSASCSNTEDSDGLSIDLNQEAKGEESFYGHQEYGNQNTPVDAVISLEESLADFEEERMSILKQLKVLEEKLLTLDDDERHRVEDVEENGNHVLENGHLNGEANGHEDGFPNDGHLNGEANGHEDGFPNDGHLNGEANGHEDEFPNERINGKHHQLRRIAGQKGISLLPLFDAICDENGDVVLNGNGFYSNGVHNSYGSKLEVENKKLAIEEVDHLYERLQALEADREFLKHCISSLKKGDKGMELLQEILQHLRDLRNVELRVRNLCDGAII